MSVATPVRSTSVYTFVAVVSMPGMGLDTLLASLDTRPEVGVHQSFVSGDELTLRVRIPTGGQQLTADTYAKALAATFVDLLHSVGITSAVLRTGFGANQRTIVKF